jgi:uncharacterized membrane protein
MIDKLITTGAILTLVVLTSCYYDKEELLYPEGLCLDVNMSYSQDIEPLISARCYGCHSNTQSQTAGAGISLEGYTNFSAFAQSNTERLIGALKQDGSFSPMPKGGNPWTTCEIDQLQSWIDDGLQNN